MKKILQPFFHLIIPRSKCRFLALLIIVILCFQIVLVTHTVAEQQPNSSSNQCEVKEQESARNRYEQFRECAERTKDQDDLNKTLDEAEKAFEHYQSKSKKSNVSEVQAKLNQLSLTIDVIKWLQITEERLAEEIWVPTMSIELENVQAQEDKWLRLFTKQIEEIPSLQLLLLTESSENIQIAYAQINLALSLLHIKTSNLINYSLKSKSFSWESIEQLLKKAQTSSDKRSQTYAIGYLGNLHELHYEQTKDAQDLLRAQELTSKALSLAKDELANTADGSTGQWTTLAQGEWQTAVYRWQWQYGRIKKLQSKTAEAIESFKAAVATIELIRKNIISADSEAQFSFRDLVKPVYREYVSLLLQPGSSTISNLELARKTIELLQIAELENFLQCSLRITKTIDEIAANDPTTATIYPIVLSNRLEIILSQPGKPLRHFTPRTPSDQHTVEVALKKLRYLLEQPYFSEEGQKLSHQVYEWLIQPIEREIPQSHTKTLLFVLDGALQNIPMAALFDGEKYLVEKYATTIAPRLQLSPTKTLNKRKALLAAFSEKSSDFRELKYAKEEVSVVKGIFKKNATTLVGQEFKPATLTERVRSSSYSIIHLATHGQFSVNRKETFIVAAPLNVESAASRISADVSSGTLGTNRLTNLFSAETAPAIDLLVLSACETATGDDRDILGLAGIAARSGARSTIATLWSIQDESTVEFMKQFYQAWTGADGTPPQTKAEALRTAQLYLLQKSPYKAAYKPSHWAAYILVGDWH